MGKILRIYYPSGKEIEINGLSDIQIFILVDVLNSYNIKHEVREESS